MCLHSMFSGFDRGAYIGTSMGAWTLTLSYTMLQAKRDASFSQRVLSVLVLWKMRRLVSSQHKSSGSLAQGFGLQSAQLKTFVFIPHTW